MHYQVFKMPAPTALQRAPLALAEEQSATIDSQRPDLTNDISANTTTTISTLPPSHEDTVTPMSIDETMTMTIDPESRPLFPPSAPQALHLRSETRKVPVPPHRLTPLKAHWPKIYPPLVEHLKLQVRMNTKAKSVELRTSKVTTDSGALQKGEDFVRAFMYGFDVDDVSISFSSLQRIITYQGKHANLLNHTLGNSPPPARRPLHPNI